MKIYNFNPGPAMFPKKILLKIQKNFHNWNKSNCSILEISHRSKNFLEYAINTEKNFRELLNIPSEYHVLFAQGGARGQFSAIPLNLLKPHETSDYINSGFWSYAAFLEAKKFCHPKNINIKYINNSKLHTLLPMNKWKLNPDSQYVHYCPNETIEGISIFEEPNFSQKIVIGDFSSVILSRVINIKKYSLIYASAQKNIGPAGLTIIIIKKDLLKNITQNVPSILNYQILFKTNSMFNTPPIFSWYVAGLTFKWLKKKGGIAAIEKKNILKAKTLYKYIDSTEFYNNLVVPENRSLMNITFFLKNHTLTPIFLNNAEKNKLYGLKGHSAYGGIRASIYNAMSIKGIFSLIKFMKYFEKKFG
ncbi:3-phosphoserine/phosphohydroxythreonine transaminase [Buchnera aphidicola]|uniref:Phosphoserine aminotransferase n=1 Tax=Buchnera aphidicola subsp. Tuberolachnus salignus TaxID=98804 RepID=A0A170PBS9_BUCTT|nr:3-phosphoserine/phosphohydroxythreonine transaminase [Buchnera aphidicola]CUR53179.1 Phosphoserine aminotransferase [Buchnera aphidicola (Tuberolachnus salignus)]